MQWRAGQEERPLLLLGTELSQGLQIPEFAQGHAPMIKNPLVEYDLSLHAEWCGTRLEPWIIGRNGSEVLIPQPLRCSHGPLKADVLPSIQRRLVVGLVLAVLHLRKAAP